MISDLMSFLLLLKRPAGLWEFRADWLVVVAFCFEMFLEFKAVMILLGLKMSLLVTFISLSLCSSCLY